MADSDKIDMELPSISFEGVGEVTIDSKVNEAQLTDEVTNDTNVKFKIARLLHTIIKKSPSLTSLSPHNYHAPSSVPFPIAHYVSCDKFTVQDQVFLAHLSTSVEPLSSKNAMKDVRWRTAMQTKIRALEDNGTWGHEKNFL